MGLSINGIFWTIFGFSDDYSETGLKPGWVKVTFCLGHVGQ